MSAPAHSDISPLAFVALSLAAFGSGISQRVTDPLLPRFAAEFGVSLGAASWTVTIFTISHGVSQLFFGPLGDRFGKYRVIAGAGGHSRPHGRPRLAAHVPRIWPGAVSRGRGFITVTVFLEGACVFGAFAFIA